MVATPVSPEPGQTFNPASEPGQRNPATARGRAREGIPADGKDEAHQLALTPAVPVGVLKHQDRADEPTACWSAVLARLETCLAAQHFRQYLAGTRALAYDPAGPVLQVVAASPIHMHWLEGKLSRAIHEAVADIVGAPVRVDFLPDVNSANGPPSDGPGARVFRSRRNLAHGVR